MKIGILTDLTPWNLDQLMLRLRRLFAYSVGVWLIGFSLLSSFVMIGSIPPDMGHEVISPILFFCLAELSLWFMFIRTWRELSRRLK